MGGIWAVVPVKDLAQAKQRLAPVLTAEQRRGLYRAMLSEVLAALSRVTRLAGVLVVTRDPEARALAEAAGAEVLHEPENDGHTAAVKRAARALADRGAAGLLQLPGDLPLLTPADVDSLLDAHRPAPAVTIAPSHDRRGSNAMLCSPPDGFPFRFGNDSFYPHLAAARRLGIEPTVVVRPGLALDIDDGDDLRAFLAAPSASRACAYLRGAGLDQPNSARSRGSTRSA